MLYRVIGIDHDEADTWSIVVEAKDPLHAIGQGMYDYGMKDPAKGALHEFYATHVIAPNGETWLASVDENEQWKVTPLPFVKGNR